MRGLMMSSAMEKLPSSPRIDGLNGILVWFFCGFLVRAFWAGFWCVCFWCFSEIRVVDIDTFVGMDVFSRCG